MNVIVPTVLLLVLISLISDANSWRGITPLRSSCDDVKKLLKVDTCILPVSDYTLPDFQVHVEFQNQSCDIEPRAWRVPKGTVTALSLSPNSEMRPAEFGLDLSRYEKVADTEIVGLEHYYNDNDGVTVDVSGGFVQRLFLYPRISDERLRCQPKSSGKVDRVSFLLGEDQGLVQAWLSLQPRTKIPVRLPSYLGKETRSIYAILESVSQTAYEIQLAFTADCSKDESCHYGTVSGRTIKAREDRPAGKSVSLNKRLTAYFGESVCGAICSESTLTWDEDGYRYTIGLKGQTLEVVTKAAKSSIANTAP